MRCHKHLALENKQKNHTSKILAIYNPATFLLHSTFILRAKNLFFFNFQNLFYILYYHLLLNMASCRYANIHEHYQPTISF